MPFGGVGDNDAGGGELVPKLVRSRKILGVSRSFAGFQQIRRPSRQLEVRHRSVEVETQHAIPPPQQRGFLSLSDRGAGELRDEGHRCRQVKVVCDRGPEPRLKGRGCIGVTGGFTALGGPFLKALSEVSQRSIGAREAVFAEVQLGAVLGLQREVAKGQRVEPLVFELSDSKEVAGRLGHSRTGQHQQSCVKPEAHHTVAGHSFRLRDLCLMVREDVVGTACVDVKSSAEKRHRHG